MLLEILRLSWQALWERKGRTVGAIVGVVIAFSALSYALLLGQTFKDYTTRYFTSNFQTNVVYVTGTQFTDADVGTLSTIDGVEAAIPIASARGVVRISGQAAPIPVTVYGVDPALLRQLLPSNVVYDGEMVVGSSMVLIGYYVAFDRSTGQQRISVGSPLSLSIGRRSINAIASGILATGALGYIDTARGVVMDISSFRQATGVTTYSVVVLVLRDPSLVEQVANDVRAAFPNVDVISPQTVLQTINSFLTSFQLFLGLIAGVSTIITALWLYDTMSIGVVQRTKEIGVLRALGYKRRHVLAMFLGEAAIVALLGVAIGVALLFPLSQMGLPFGSQSASAATPRTAPHPTFNISHIEVDPLIVAATAALVIGINLLGALLPAYRASRINIVAALRYE
ncbi:ABC transporter permease [Pyrobaculum islandicum]|uniref:ABC transporter permease n=1 Tax=Pyrobaculum islandicum TaxID=2277 RepID=UPI00069DCAAD|nr:ABC transporter permease [Pyrobaculum islandicum]